jgi:hypothetical protein
VFSFFEGPRIALEIVYVEFAQQIWVIIDCQARTIESSVIVAIEAVLITIDLLACDFYFEWNDKSIKWSELELDREVKSRLVSNCNDIELIILLDYLVSEFIVNQYWSLVKSY